jgi:preprotein translocase subunit SecG
MLTFSFYSLLVLFILVCLILILLILIQKGRGGGLASAFGGAGGSTAFGSKTGDVLTWATSIVFGVFLLLAIALNLISNSMDRQQREQARLNEVAPVQQPQQPSAGGLPFDLPPAGPTSPAPAAPAPETATPAAPAPAEGAPAPAPSATPVEKPDATPAAPAAPAPEPAK